MEDMVSGLHDLLDDCHTGSNWRMRPVFKEIQSGKIRVDRWCRKAEAGGFGSWASAGQ